MCNTLICEIVRGHLNMFQSDDLSPVLRASLQWNSIEQYFFWQLINAHEIPTRSFLPMVKYVDPAKHPEACANLILLLKLEKPSFELVRALLSRSGVNDALSVTALHFWSCPDNQHSSRFASILKSLIMAPLSQRGDGSLSNSATTGSASRDGREKRRNGAKNQVTPDNQVELSLILTHLDSIRRTCRNISLLQDEDVQLALQEVVRSSKVPLSVKDHFSDLLALAEDQSVTSPANRYGVSQNGRSISDPLHRLGGTTTDGAENSSLLSRPASLGSKGGHSLRNLDSRRAAEAERRQLPTSAGSHSNKRSSRTSGHQNDALDSDLTDETEAVSILSSSSDSSEDDDDDGDEKRQANSMRLIKRKKHSSANSCNSSGTTRPALGKQSDTAAESSYKDRRPSCKRVLQRFTGAAENDDEEDDDDDDKGLEVVVLDEESGDEKTNEDADRVRPPKRRKTAVNRFLLDD
ncbi:unnamed protein product [Dicrocoelium dendriticum]|nr:unnamed protein product [Dicrocoelium dendriticum]